MPREPLSKNARELTRTLLEAQVLDDRQAREIERLLAEGREEKAGKLLGKYLDRKNRDESKGP